VRVSPSVLLHVVVSGLATGSGSPRPWFADHATKAETISMSPCAKFTVRVVL